MNSISYMPRLCDVGILTAALQEPYGREPFEQDPLQASRDVLTKFWIPTAGRHGLHLELGGAFYVEDGYVPPEKMLDPVAPHVPVRTPKNGAGVDLSDADTDLILESCSLHNTKVRTIGVFENLLHPDLEIRAQIHEHVKRQARAAKKLGADGLTLFVGRNMDKLLDENLVELVEVVIPLFQYIIDLGLTVFLENCPMPGWNAQGLWVNNLCNTPYLWVAIEALCEKAGIAKHVVINYDASHTILQKGQVAGSFAYMAAAQRQQMIGRIHCKNQHHEMHVLAAADGRGLACLRGDFEGGQLSPDESVHWMSWCEMDSHHGMPGIQYYNPSAQLAGHEVDWLEHQYLLRSQLGIDPNGYVVTLEHEWNTNRVKASDEAALERIDEMLARSAAFIRGIDAAAEAMYQSQVWTEQRGLSLPNEADDRWTRYAPEMAAHADLMRERALKCWDQVHATAV